MVACGVMVLTIDVSSSIFNVLKESKMYFEMLITGWFYNNFKNCHVS